MRFDDSLKTVLAADTSTAFGAESAFRQLVDLVARGRATADGEVLDRLRALRNIVPAPIRAATARAAALAQPDVALVGLFAEDVPAVAAPILRTAALDDAAWEALIPQLGPTGRAVLRERRDLSVVAQRALAAFGSVDFTLTHDGARAEVAMTEAIVAVPEPAAVPGFEISELVARIAAYQERRETGAAEPAMAPVAEHFRFETDAGGHIRWVDGVVRGALLGLSIAGQTNDAAQVDGIAIGAFRQRAPMRDARLVIDNVSDVGGEWRLAATPAFDAVTGRFTGYRGMARRPRADENAALRRDTAASEALRRLVHELRTPTSAIVGFSELMERELMGTVPEPYRSRAAAIHRQGRDLVAAIEDLDIAARIEGDALELRPGEVALAPLLTMALRDLEPLMRLRGCAVLLAPLPEDLSVRGDDRTLERLVTRLLTAVVAAGSENEEIALQLASADRQVTLTIDRPAALATVADDSLFRIDAENEAALPGAPLLGTGFALRLVRNLATELGGSLTFAQDRLTLRLPAALHDEVGQASTR